MIYLHHVTDRVTHKEWELRDDWMTFVQSFSLFLSTVNLHLQIIETLFKGRKHSLTFGVQVIKAYALWITLYEKDNKRNLKWPYMQRWQCPILNSTLESFVWSNMN